MPKRGLGLNVYDAAMNRIEWTFDNFEKVYLSFSAGKDSTVMLHMACNYARLKNKKLGVLIVDLEGQYKFTIEHAKRCFEEYSDVVDLHWVCLPIALRNAVSVYEPKWICWDFDRKKDWIREMPDRAIHEFNHNFSFFEKGMEFEDFVPAFGEGDELCRQRR